MKVINQRVPRLRNRGLCCHGRDTLTHASPLCGRVTILCRRRPHHCPKIALSAIEALLSMDRVSPTLEWMSCSDELKQNSPLARQTRESLRKGTPKHKLFKRVEVSQWLIPGRGGPTADRRPPMTRFSNGFF